MTLRERKQELYRESVNLRGKTYDVRNWKLGQKIIRKQTELYKQWKFYDEFLKAKEKIK